MASIFIKDGFTLRGLVPGLRGVYPDLSFQYRPALPEAVYAYLRSPKESGKQNLKAVVEFLAKHVVSWDASEDGVNHLPVSEDALRRVYQPVLEQMANCVAGYTAAQWEEDGKN